MSKTILLFFWIMWLLDVLMALYGYNEFLMGVFGRYASPTGKYYGIWIVLLLFILLVICGSVYFKNHNQNFLALALAAIPLLLALPYLLFLGTMMLGGKNNWR